MTCWLALTVLALVSCASGATLPTVEPCGLPGGYADFGGLSSHYVPFKPNGDYTWQEFTYLVPHEPVRFLLVEVRALVRKGLDGTPWKNDLVCEFVSDFVAVIHHHHDAEETVFFPLLAERITLPESVTTDHITMNRMLDDISSFCAHNRTAEGYDPVAWAKVFSNKWNALIEHMLPHLEEEEREIIPKFDAFTPDEMDSMVDRIVQDMGLDGNSRFLPMIAIGLRLWAGEAGFRSFISILPPPVELLREYLWQPQREYEWMRYQHLAKDIPPPGRVMIGWEVRAVGVLVAVLALFYIVVRKWCCNRSAPHKKAD